MYLLLSHWFIFRFRSVSSSFWFSLEQMEREEETIEREGNNRKTKYSQTKNDEKKNEEGKAILLVFSADQVTFTMNWQYRSMKMDRLTLFFSSIINQFFFVFGFCFSSFLDFGAFNAYIFTHLVAFGSKIEMKNKKRNNHLFMWRSSDLYLCTMHTCVPIHLSCSLYFTISLPWRWLQPQSQHGASLALQSYIVLEKDARSE